MVAVGSRSLQTAEAFIRDTGLGQEVAAYGSYQEVLQNPDVDAIYIPLPSAFHLEWVRKAAAAHKHVLLEKPIAVVWPSPYTSLPSCEARACQEATGAGQHF